MDLSNSPIAGTAIGTHRIQSKFTGLLWDYKCFLLLADLKVL